VRKYEVSYQARQVFLCPFPAELMLRNHVSLPATSYLETKAKRSGHMINFGAETLLSEQSDTGIPPETAG
jgi:hypothetical protein